jgi:hypothetical protein
MQLTAPVAPAQHLQRHALKGVALANDRYLIGIVVEVVGSLSSGPLITSHTPTCNGFSLTGSRTHGFCGSSTDFSRRV